MSRQRVNAYTLVDVTASGVVHVRDSNRPEYHQQQNLKMLLQIVGLRAQPFDITVRRHDHQSISSYNFHSRYHNSSHTVWEVEFYHEHPMVWSTELSEFGLLALDAHGVPITSDLDNSADFSLDIFDTQDEVNLYFVGS